MAKYMFDLPGRPPFPVYGLGGQFEGGRWLVIWQDRRRFYTVTLGHGQPPKPDNAITVTTTHKTAKRPIDGPPGAATGPTGYESALLAALDDLSRLATLQESPGAAAWLLDQMNQVDWTNQDQRNQPADIGPAWDHIDVLIDGEPHAALTRTHNERTATLIDLPTVVIRIASPAAAHPPPPLINVTDSLNSYE